MHDRVLEANQTNEIVRIKILIFNKQGYLVVKEKSSYLVVDATATAKYNERRPKMDIKSSFLSFLVNICVWT